MKPQDIVFFLILVGLMGLRKPKLLVAAGLLCIILAIPLFQFWVFFTAQRLVMYAAAFFLAAALLFGWKPKK